jgi:glutamyl-tRNA synthetase
MTPSSQVRVRVAPSPTGDPHVGTAYQALFNYAFARRHGGRFVLRIEDTDRARSTAGSEAAILDSLRWLGLGWDEGPDVGGPHAPYRQSERVGIHREHVERLLAAGRAYRCFCTRERLEALRAQRSGEEAGYDRRCRGMDPTEAERRARAGEASVVRMKIPLEGESVFHDLLRGEIRKDWASVDDQVILKSDGFPTYHLANVVDDHLMGITHVIRGEEWINSVPKHVRLYHDLGWEPPVFCHLPLLRNPDRSKLSKRRNPTSIGYYRVAGILPQALLNFLGLMGWTMPDGEEKFSLEQMCASLDLERISLGGPIFDVAKLRWLNARYIREDLSPEALLSALEEWGFAPGRLARIVPLVQPRLETLADWGRLTAPFFCDDVAPDPAALTLKGRGPEEVAEVMQLCLWRLEEQRDFSRAALAALFRGLSEALGIRLRELTGPFYVALSGGPTWTPLFDSMEVLGPDLVRVRIRRAVEALGGISGAQRKRLEKRYRELAGGGASAGDAADGPEGSGEP